MFHPTPRLHAIVLCFIALASLPTIARATLGTPQIDQQFLAGTVNSSITTYAVSANQTWGQSFTCGQEGFLTQIDIQLSRNANVTLPIQFNIRAMSGGLPNLSPAGLLFTTSIPAASVPVAPFGFANSFTTSISLLNNEIPVAIGDQLAVIGSTSSPSPDWYNWASQNNFAYASGTALWKPVSSSTFTSFIERDSGFRTWVAVPEPTTTSLLLLLAPLVLNRCRFKAIVPKSSGRKS